MEDKINQYKTKRYENLSKKKKRLVLRINDYSFVIIVDIA